MAVTSEGLVKWSCDAFLRLRRWPQIGVSRCGGDSWVWNWTIDSSKPSGIERNVFFLVDFLVFLPTVLMLIQLVNAVSRCVCDSTQWLVFFPSCLTKKMCDFRHFAPKISVAQCFSFCWPTTTHGRWHSAKCNNTEKKTALGCLYALWLHRTIPCCNDVSNEKRVYRGEKIPSYVRD